jgi:predicted DNA-binding transcriptional regulator YafY
MLAQGGRPTVHELAASFRTRRETIYRDLRALQDAGYPIMGDERGRLSRPQLMSPSIPDIRFSPGEMDALLVAVAEAGSALPTVDALASATLKLRALRESEPGSSGSSLSEMFDSWACGTKDYRTHEDRIALVIEAILRKQRCGVEYQAPSRSEPQSI